MTRGNRLVLSQREKTDRTANGLASCWTLPTCAVEGYRNLSLNPSLSAFSRPCPGYSIGRWSGDTQGQTDAFNLGQLPDRMAIDEGNTSKAFAACLHRGRQLGFSTDIRLLSQLSSLFSHFSSSPASTGFHLSYFLTASFLNPVSTTYSFRDEPTVNDIFQRLNTSI